MIRTGLIIAALAIALFVFRAPARIFGYQAIQRALPCTVPIQYAIASIDERFGITQAQVQDLLEKSERTWEEAAGKELFAYSDSPVLRVNFVYDDRQATTERLRELGLDIKEDVSSYNELKSTYESERSAYVRSKNSFEQRVDRYEADAAAYDAQVRKWNAQGGAPRSVHAELERERMRLESVQANLEVARDALNAETVMVNALAARLNRLAGELNIGAAEFNAEARTQDEFEEAVYESLPGAQTITVYEYDNLSRLQRVLTHELGHALGIEHVEDEAAIMYEINQGDSLRLRPQDIAALKATCRIQT